MTDAVTIPATLSVLIVDDEAPARARLRDLLADIAAEVPNAVGHAIRQRLSKRRCVVKAQRRHAFEGRRAVQTPYAPCRRRPESDRLVKELAAKAETDHA